MADSRKLYAKGRPRHYSALSYILFATINTNESYSYIKNIILKSMKTNLLVAFHVNRKSTYGKSTCFNSRIMEFELTRFDTISRLLIWDHGHYSNEDMS